MCSATPVVSDQLIPFGHVMREHFPLDPEFKNLNHGRRLSLTILCTTRPPCGLDIDSIHFHIAVSLLILTNLVCDLKGSFGTFPLVVRDVQRKLRDEEEASPDLYLRHKRNQLLQTSREAVAKFLKVPTNEVVFVKNATMGVNVVLRNLVYTPGDAIVYFADIYGGCEKTIASLVESTPVQPRKVSYIHPVTHEELVELFVEEVKKARAEGLRVKVALFDVVASVPGIRFPFEKLVEVCRDEGILSCVDGAHGIGMVPLNLGKLQPDFFVSNCHK